MGSPASKSGVTPVMEGGHPSPVTYGAWSPGRRGLALHPFLILRARGTGDMQKVCLNKDLTSSQLSPGHNSPSPQQEVAGGAE